MSGCGKRQSSSERRIGGRPEEHTDGRLRPTCALRRPSLQRQLLPEAAARSASNRLAATRPNPGHPTDAGLFPKAGLRSGAPASSGLQHVDNAAENPTIIDPTRALPPPPSRQMRLDPCPGLVVQPVKLKHSRLPYRILESEPP